jgi:2,3,4,5-tetrahydropyridine-2,6-dicarboxylate N-succinyltransferase
MAGMDAGRLRGRVEALARSDVNVGSDEAREVVRDLLRALERSEVRAAEPGPDGWRAVPWVKEGILLAFRHGRTARFPFGGGEAEGGVGVAGGAGAGAGGGNPETDDGFRFFDRDTLPLRPTDGVAEGVRIVPGGSSVRAGAYLAPGVVIMPPAYVNVGAWVGAGTMIDSHALVGSCAQIGERVHLSAGAQVGGVLEPVGLRPVVIEDEAMIGGNTGVFEGILVGRRAVLAPGVQLTAATPLYDLVRGEILRSRPGQPLAVPEGAVVVPGSRPASGDFAREHGLHLYAPMIVKYRDERTDAATALEEVLR